MTVAKIQPKRSGEKVLSEATMVIQHAHRRVSGSKATRKNPKKRGKEIQLFLEKRAGKNNLARRERDLSRRQRQQNDAIVDDEKGREESTGKFHRPNGRTTTREQSSVK